MSDLMLSAVLNMPLPDDPSQMDVLTWMQFRDRARQSADELDRLRAENERLREALEKIANYLPMFDYVVNDDYGHPDISKPGSPFDRGRAQEAEHLSSIARAALQDKGDEE